MAKSEVFCNECDEPLDHLPNPPAARAPCPVCGSTARRFVRRPQDTLTLGDRVQAHVDRAAEWMGEHPGWSALGVGASAGGALVSPFLGPLWGGGVGVALAGLSYWAFKKAIAEGRWPG